jgi:hypothetical protein
VKEPERLLAGEATALERKLLQAMAEERPSPELSSAMARGLTTGGAIVGVGKSVGLATLGKGSALLALALALGAGAAAVLSSPSTPTTSSAPPASTHAAQASAPSAQPSSAEADAHDERSPVPTQPSASSSTDKVSRSASAEVRPRATSDIAAEIRLLDAAKRHLQGGRLTEAMAALDEYRSRFPKGALGQEATVLRIEALEKSGQHGTAQTLARRFVRKHRSSTYVARVSRLVGGLDTEAPQRPGAESK